MKQPELKEHICQIAYDIASSIDQRIEKIFSIRQEYGAKDEEEALRQDVVIFSVLIEMIQKENDKHEHDRPFLQLTTMLAETYVKLEDYRPLGELAQDILEVLREEETAADILEETIPRTIYALKKSVYRHNLYEILLRYIKAVLPGNPESDSIQPLVALFLKFHILLDDHAWTARLLTKELQLLISRMLSKSELLDIILHPELDYLAVDRVEYTWDWEQIYYDVEEELNRLLAEEPRQMGFCFLYWEEKQKLIKEKYGIDWNTPGQMNPHIMFD